MTYDEIVPTMLRWLPGLEQAYRDEVSRQGDDVGVYIILANVLVPSIREAVKQKADQKTLGQLFSFLEEMARSTDIEVYNALAVGVCELLGYDPEMLQEARGYMGPGTRKASDEIEAFWRRARKPQ